jgi:hypothetical protein
VAEREDEYGWLIEGNENYWDGHGIKSFTTDPNYAVRFARQEDAEQVKYWLLSEWAFALRTTLHCFVAGVVSQPTPARPPDGGRAGKE